jgi:hypothetical protein
MDAEQLLGKLGYPGEKGWRMILPKPRLIRTAIPAKVAGVYLLVSQATIVYAGRSDQGLRERLLGHEHIEHAGLVIWRKCISVYTAYLLESQWYERVGRSPSTLNAIRPAAPRGCGGVKGLVPR